MTADEELLLDILSNNKYEQYNDIIYTVKNKFVFEQLSHMRGNIIEWLELEGKRVLEINACYGAVSTCIASKATNLDLIVNENSHFEICKKRFSHFDNVKVYMQDFEDLHLDTLEYDFVVIANPFFTSMEHFVRTIDSYKKFIKNNGSIVVVLDNKYGLKYFSGKREPNNGIRFSGVEGYKGYYGVRCFSRQEILDAIEKLDFKEITWYYPYPDRVMPLCIYSDDYLPSKGELKNDGRSFGEAEMITFDEELVWDNVIKDRLFEQFSNSYMLLLEV